jgi:phage host-nuclease inhibitor protein Gam
LAAHGLLTFGLLARPKPSPDTEVRFMNRPPFRAVTPILTCEEDIDVALRQLVEIHALEDADQAEYDLQVAQIRADIQARQIVQIGREKMTFADYRSKVEEQIRAYCEPRQAELLADGKTKSRKFTHGEIGWRKSPAKLVDIDGNAATTTAKLMVCSRQFGTGGLLNKVRGILAELAISAAVAAADLFKVEIKLDRTAALKLAQVGKLKPEWLEKHNLRVDEGSETFSIKPSDAVVKTESRVAA